MKRTVFLSIILVVVLTMTSAAFGSVQLSNESKFGMPVVFTTSDDYPGDIRIDGIYVYRESTGENGKDQYVFTIVYSKGILATVKIQGNELLRTSFFDPPNGDVLKIFYLSEADRISWDDKKVQYRVDTEIFSQIEHITVFLYDVLYNNSDENISCYFKTKDINFDKIPSADDLTKGYEITSEAVSDSLPRSPSSWALKEIEELQLSGIFNDTVFDAYEKNITRLGFINLMVPLYEKLTGKTISAEGVAAFKDTDDICALKAASIGITSGIGGNLFDPDRDLNREDMAVFVIRTLKLAKIKLDCENPPVIFNDDSKISVWAKESVYTARCFDIIGGMEDNTFSPNTPTTNEQALVLLNRLISRFGGIKWYDEADGSRFYLRFEGKLYKIDLSKNIVLDNTVNGKDLFCMSLEDINTLLNLAHLKAGQLEYESTQNPNYMGTLKVPEYGYMNQTASNIYSGVDKTGEISIISFSTGFSGEKFTAHIFMNEKLEVTGCIGFNKINFYDHDGERSMMYALPIKDIFTSLGISYTLEYNNAWNIYIIEF